MRHQVLCLVVFGFVASRAEALRGKNPAVTSEQVCRALNAVCGEVFRAERGVGVLAHGSEVIRYHQSRNKAATKSKRRRNRLPGPLPPPSAVVLVGPFVASHPTPPSHITLDLDAAADPVHWHQEGRFSHGHYDGYCFLPLYVVCESQLPAAHLCPASRGTEHHAAAVLEPAGGPDPGGLAGRPDRRPRDGGSPAGG